MLNSPLPRILIVDDDPDSRACIADMIQSLGGVPLEAKDGEDGLEKILKWSPDIVLLDQNMPRMTGRECCRRIKNNPVLRLIPVIMITSNDSLSERIEAIEAGADEFLSKPARPLELLARMRSLLKIKRLNEEFETAENVIFSLARAIEAKDRYTEGHTERVTTYALALGQALHCSEDDLKALRQGGILHDVGKIGVPDQILNKPGRLTPEEFEIVKTHPMSGYRICENLKSLRGALPCIRWHHERLDGSGYPDGLKGDAIPLLAKILAVADVFDALTSTRPYRAALELTEAFDIMAKDAARGGLDSALLETFVKDSEVLSAYRHFSAGTKTV